MDKEAQTWWDVLSKATLTAAHAKSASNGASHMQGQICYSKLPFAGHPD